MSKVDWITWKTNRNEIINPGNIYDDINIEIEECNNIINKIEEVLYTEMNNGGLDSSTLSIMGTSPAKEKAMKILSNISELRLMEEKLKNNIYNSAIEQKKEEKEQLIRSIEKKLLEEENILNNKLSIKEKMINSNYTSNREIENIIDISNERIRSLKEKLDLAKEL